MLVSLELWFGNSLLRWKYPHQIQQSVEYSSGIPHCSSKCFSEILGFSSFIKKDLSMKGFVFVRAVPGISFVKILEYCSHDRLERTCFQVCITLRQNLDLF